MKPVVVGPAACRILVGDRVYTAPVVLNLVTTGEGVEITTNPPTRRSVNVCGSCGRYDLVEVVARSLDEAVGLGWLVTDSP